MTPVPHATVISTQISSLKVAQGGGHERLSRSEERWGEIRRDVTWAGNCLVEKCWLLASRSLCPDHGYLKHGHDAEPDVFVVLVLQQGLGNGIKRTGAPHTPSLCAIVPPEGCHQEGGSDPVSQIALKEAICDSQVSLLLSLSSCVKHVTLGQSLIPHGLVCTPKVSLTLIALYLSVTALAV